MTRKILIIVCIFLSINALAQEANRNVMLNASSSSKPRDISIGLPGDDGGTAIFEDGLPVAFSSWPAYPYFHWVGGNSYSSQALIKIEESALRSSSIGYAINSFTKLGSDKWSGSLTASTSSFGLKRLDGNANGPLGNNLFCTVGAYFNYDPTSVCPKSRKYINQMQVFKAGISKKWKEGEASILYKLSVNKDAAYGYASAPFRYTGDGSISNYNGFKLGRDCYFPDNDAISYIDITDGTIHSDNMGDMNTKVMHDATLKAEQKLSSGWILKGNLHFSGSGHLDNLGIFEAGIDEISGIGPVQKRLAMYCHSTYFDILGAISALRQTQKHTIEIGLNEWYDKQYLAAPSFIFAHTVSANPDRVAINGNMTWDFNESAEFDDGKQTLTGAYAMDDWSINDRLNLYFGLRMELLDYKVKSAVNPEGETFNDRTNGFFLNNGVCQIQEIQHSKIDGVALVNLSYRIADKLFVSGEYLYSRKNKSVSNYGMSSMPLQSPSVNQLFISGVMYDNDWLSLTSMISYITSENNLGVLHLTKQISGVSETISTNSVYGIGTLGWTTDINAKKGQFAMHLLATLQNPKYHNFKNSLTFSNGVSETIDYSGNYVTGISRILLEIDPSYTYRNWRFWASGRYFSRQYASRVNNAWFKGHWETFAGINYRATKNCTVSLDIVNLLFQRGASGSLDVADTITDKSQLQDLLISGSYIRPFTINLSVSINL